MLIVKGTRPRPRVALIGGFDSTSLENLTRLFPTSWVAEDFEGIEEVVNPIELDLVIIGYDVLDGPPTWLTNKYIICFSDKIPYLPAARNQNLWIHCNESASTEVFTLPPVPLSYERLREVDLAEVTNTKGWNIIKTERSFYSSEIRQLEEQVHALILAGALLIGPYTSFPFATIFTPPLMKTGVAWLPNKSFRVFPWVELICTEWGKTDKDSFPEFGDWTKTPEWMLPDEENLSKSIDEQMAEKKRMTIEYDLKSEN